jgi:hypothetical protein
MTQTATPPASLLATAPALPIRRALRRVDARLRSKASARGLGTALLAAAIGSGVGMAVDFALTLPNPVRWAIWAAWAATVGLVVVLGVLRPLFRKSRWIDLAAVAERADPRLMERLTGSIALLEDADHASGSPALIAALAEDAAEHVVEFDPRLVKGGKPLALRMGMGLIAIALVAAPSFVRPDPFRTLALRFFAPWMDLDRVSWFALSVLPGDKVVAIGSDLAIEAKVAPRFRSTAPLPAAATLEWTDEKGESHRVRMTAKASDSSATARGFETTLPRLAGSVSYRVSTDATRSRAYQVTAIDPPMICEISALIEPPNYTKLPPSKAKDPARIEALEGSRIVLSFQSCMPFRKAGLTWPSLPPAKPREVEVPSSNGMKHATITAEAEASGPFVLTLREDVHHNLDGRPETRQLVVRADAPPTLAIKGPPATSEARPDDLLQLGVAARDDFAVASAELHYEIRRSKSENSQPGKVALKLDGLGTPLAKGVVSLPLRDLGLAVGDVLAYRVKVLDNLPAPRGPNMTWSESRTISISTKAEPMIAKDDRLRRESFQARLDEIRVANASNRRETEQLRYAADAAQRTGQAWDAGRDADLAARETEARSVEDKLQLLARDLQNDSTFAPLARPTRQAAEVEAEAGRAQLDQARKAPDSTKRLAELRQADTRLGALGNRLDEIRRKFDALAKLDVDRQKLRDLAAKEDALAVKADQGADEKARLAAEQDELRKALDALLNQSPGLRAGLLNAQAEDASKLAKEARALAEKQRAEARRTTEAPLADNALREIAQAQKELEDDARRLALEVDEPLAENGRSRLDTEAVKRPVEPIERGDLPDAVRRLEEAEDGLRRLTRDVEDVPLDAKALARRLARRQELLANDVAATLGEARRKDIPADERAALVERSKPLLARQEEIAKLAAGLVPPEAQKAVAREAAQATEKAGENLRNLKPRDSENLQNNARRALNQLADALADPNRLRDETRRKFDEAKRKEEEVLRGIDRAIAESQPKPDKLDADARAATDLAEKVAPLIQKEKEAADALSKLNVEPRAIPQRDRAAARAARLADQIQAVKDQAPPRRPDSNAVPPGRWQVLGPFPTINPKVPFDPAQAVDFGAKINAPDGKPLEWKPFAPEGEEGRINLAKIFNTKDNQAAFAVAEVVSKTRRKAQLSIGSDDTLIVWLNGKQVFEHNSSRGFSPGQDKAEVELQEGVNRLAIRCGNGNGEWQFAVNVSPPPADGFDPEKAKRLRETLASARLDAQAALERLEQKSNGKMPADDLAAVLAREQRAAAEALTQERSKPPEDDPTPREQAAHNRQRLATALRNLPVAPETPALHAEAVRLAEAAARPDAIPISAQLAAEAAEALAKHLGDALPPRELAAALARAERALEAPEVQADPAQLADRQKAIAAELTHPAQPAERSAVSGQRSANTDRAEQAVGDAAALTEQARRPEPSKPVPTPDALVQAEAKAAEALDKMAADPALGPDPVAQAKTNPKPDANPPAPAGEQLAGVPSDPSLGLGPQEASRAADLATRQRQVRERLQAVMAERVGPQQDLRKDSQKLGRDLAELRDRAKEINARSQWQAQAAAELAGEQAPRSMEKGAEQLAQGRLDQARDSQRQAADQIERAAREAEDFAAGLRAEGAMAVESGEAAQQAAAASNDLAEARQALRDLARRLAQGPPGPATARAAAPGMRQAAENLRAAAQGPAAGPPAPPIGEADPDNPNPTAAPAGVAEADLAALQDLVRKKTGRQWGELPGHLRTEILQLSKGRYRDDYARLIQLYFREIAADASKAEKP